MEHDAFSSVASTEDVVRGKSPSSEEQLRDVWSTLMANFEEQKLSMPIEHFTWPHLMTVSSHITCADYEQILSDTSDMCPRREKILCANGFICQVRIIWAENHGFTGLFKQSNHGILRLSNAVRPVSGSLPWFAGNIASSTTFPCAAIKMFRAGQPSGNLLFGGRKTGQKEEQFFKYSLGTCLSEVTPYVLQWIIESFRKYSECPTQLGTSDFAMIDEDGNEEESSNFPWCLALRPRAQLASLTFESIQTIPKDTTIYDIFAYSCPSEARASAPLVRIGEIVSQTPMYPSLSGDGLFFKHQRREEDFALKPEWGTQQGDHFLATIGPRFFDEQFSIGNIRDV